MGADDDRLPSPAEWNPTTALENLLMEKALDSTATPQTTAKRLFEEALPLSVMAICHIAAYGESEGMRFNAAKYVVERTMGPAEKQAAPDGRHAWDDIYENVVTGAEEFLANGGKA